MSNTMMKEAMEKAVAVKNNDITRFIWKGNKVLGEDGQFHQTEKRIIDMNQMELQKCYTHCKTMLNNNDIQNPGRYIVLANIADQKERINAELFLRHAEQTYSLKRFTLLDSINEFLNKNRELFEEAKVEPTVIHAIPSISSEFANIPLSIVIDGCLDRLGTFNKKAITRTFILKQGIWLTADELKELAEDGDTRDRIEIIRERLNIKDVERLSINSKGLNLAQMRALLNIKPNKKYIDLTTMQLETLRSRILFNLEESVKEHIAAWERRIREIEMVAEHKLFLVQ